MKQIIPGVSILLAELLSSFVVLGVSVAAEPGKPNKKIVLIAGTKSHGPGDHEYEQGANLLKHCLDTSPNVKGVRTEVVLDGWPKDPATLEDADTILLYSDGSDHDDQAHPLLHGDRLQIIDRLMKRGVGFVALHYAVFIPVKKGGDQYLDWMGGFFDYETGDAPNHWYSRIVTRDYQVTLPRPGHPIVRGVKPFSVREEYYFNLKFRDHDQRLAPILSFGADTNDLASVVGYAVQRADGGRGFGYTGGHFHKNWQNEYVRRMVLNALLWTARIEVPPGGVISTLPVSGQAMSRGGTVWDHTKGRSGHGPYGSFRVNLAGQNHPITEGMSGFDTTDELYFNQQGGLPVEPLATARSRMTGKDEPLAFAYSYGQGRVIQTLLGHDAAAVRAAGELIRRESVWAAGRESRRD